jgi:hypothetical protein
MYGTRASSGPSASEASITCARRTGAFIAFHNVQHRYAVHGGATPAEVWSTRTRYLLEPDYRMPTRLPAKGWIEAVRYVRSSGLVDLWGKRITIEEPYRHAYVTAVIGVRAKLVTVITTDGEIAYEGPFPINRVLR